MSIGWGKVKYDSSFGYGKYENNYFGGMVIFLFHIDYVFIGRYIGYQQIDMILSSNEKYRIVLVKLNIFQHSH
jgi:hypothetical protein